MSEKSKVEQKTAAKTASKSKAAAVVSKPIAKKSAKDGLNKIEPKSPKNSRIPKYSPSFQFHYLLFLA